MYHVKIRIPIDRNEVDHFINIVMRFNDQFDCELNYVAKDGNYATDRGPKNGCFQLMFRNEIELAYFMLIAGNKINVLS